MKTFFLVIVAALVGFGLVVGCVSTPEGLKRADAVTSSVTNGIAVAERYVLPAVPSPARDILDAALGAVAAGLAAWNASQHRRLGALESASRTRKRTR